MPSILAYPNVLLKSYRRIARDLSGCVVVSLAGGGSGLRRVGLERTGTALERLVQRKCDRVLNPWTGSEGQSTVSAPDFFQDVELCLQP